MTQFYVGVKIIEAWKQEKDGQPGYGVKYPDGYVSWSPKEAFEKAYFPMGLDPTKVNSDMVKDFVKSSEAIQSFDDKTTLCKTILINDFRIINSSSCVDPKNYDHETGIEICRKRTMDKIWELLGFVVQWGNSGIIN